MKSRLSLKIAVPIALVALTAAFAVSLAQYFWFYNNEVRQAERSLQQIGQTVQKTAAIAAYLNNQELAREVIEGLEKNELVASASIEFNAHPRLSPDNHNEVQIPLASPFITGQQVGLLHLGLRKDLVKQRAKDSALSDTLLLGGYTLFGSLLVYLLVEFGLIRSIRQIAHQLSTISPGESHRLVLPELHREDELGQLVKHTNTLLDLAQFNLVSEHELLEQVANLEKRFRMIYARAGVGIFLMDQRARLVMANPAFIELIGEPTYQHLLNDNVNCVIDLFNETEKVFHILENTFFLGETSTSDLLLKEHGRPPRWVYCLLTPVKEDAKQKNDDTLLIQGIITDITERKNEEQLIRFQAERDPLTHLLNRRSAERSAHMMLAQVRFEQQNLAICLIDLDNFKPINDTHGHDAGDKALAEIALRMKQTLRSTDLLARLGGDEFLVAIPWANDHENLTGLLDKLLIAITRPIEIEDGTSVCVGASIGVAISSDEIHEIDQLITLADQSMYKVKKQGKNGYHIYAA